jgi:hypothetical protein
MKYLTILIIGMFLIIGCQSGYRPMSINNITESEFNALKPLNIQISEIEAIEPLYAFPLTPYHILAYTKCRGVPVAFIYFATGDIIIRYCYLDQGEFIGFVLDVEFYESTHKRRYIRENVFPEAVEYMTEMLERMEQGLEPLEEAGQPVEGI